MPAPSRPQTDRQLTVFSPADLEFFDENGYVVLHDAVPAENLRRLVDAIWAFIDADPDRPDTWYHPAYRTGGMIEMYQHQALWDNRQHPRVHQAFADLWGTDRLWVSEDRCSMKPPAKEGYDDRGFHHVDLDPTKLPVPFGVQGVLYLTDTTEDMGGFQCTPGFHHQLEAFVRASTAPDEKKRDLRDLPITPIPGRAGDLLIWHRYLPHGNGQNRSSRPRLAQYITMFPASRKPEAASGRIERWRNRLGPSAHKHAFPGDPRRREIEYPTATLTPLGEKLLGLRDWD